MSGIVFAIELAKGKDWPKELPKRIGDEHGPTVGLLLRLTKLLCGTGKIVILDSLVCVLHRIIELFKKGVCSSALIKKCRYWPKGVPGEIMDERMTGKGIGNTDAISGKLDGMDYNLFMMKDKDHTVKLMSTYGKLEVQNDAKDSFQHVEIVEGRRKVRRRAKFKCTEPYQNYYRARHAVDDHNHSRHLTPSIESTWVIDYRNDLPFQFIISISEVDAHKGYGQWELDDPEGLSIHQFRWKLAIGLINNDYVIDDCETTKKSVTSQRRRRQNLLKSALPRIKKYCATRKIWIKESADTHQRYICKSSNCKNRCRTYCVCDPSRWMCKVCFHLHVEAEVTDSSS